MESAEPRCLRRSTLWVTLYFAPWPSQAWIAPSPCHDTNGPVGRAPGSLRGHQERSELIHRVVSEGIVRLSLRLQSIFRFRFSFCELLVATTPWDNQLDRSLIQIQKSFLSGALRSLLDGSTYREVRPLVSHSVTGKRPSAAHTKPGSPRFQNRAHSGHPWILANRDASSTLQKEIFHTPSRPSGILIKNSFE